MKVRISRVWYHNEHRIQEKLNSSNKRRDNQKPFPSTMSDIEFSPSTLEVDYDKNLTELYRAITDQDWDTAVRVCKQDPDQAATWVVRHYEPEDEEDGDEGELEIMWRFLPLHSACARQPPASVVTALLRAYPDGAKCQDDQGMYALHYACGNQASRDIVRLLLVSFPEAAQMVDPRGMLPVHYLACWGPSSIAVVDMLLVANRNVSQARDMDGNTPIDLAREGDYPERDGVITALRKWIANGPRNDSTATSVVSSHKSGTRSTSTKRSSQSKTSARTSGTKTSSKSRKSSSTSQSRGVKKRDTEDSYLIKRKDTDDSYQNIKRKPSEESYNYRRLSPAHGDEEKKEEPIMVDDLDDPHRMVANEVATLASRAGGLKPAISPDEVKRLQEEIRSLKSERIGMSKRLAETSSKMVELDEAKKKIREQDATIENLKEQLNRANKDCDEASRKSEEMSTSHDIKYANELEETKSKLREAKAELKGLRLSLTDMMEQHQSHRKKSGNVNERLASLVYNLESMMDRQSSLEQSVKERREKRKKALNARKEALKKLLELDDESDEEESSLEVRFKKQTKEMEAIAAVINAARD